MANTTYEELADTVFNKIKDYDFASMDEYQAYKIVIDYIDPACLKFESCNQDLDKRDDDLQEFTLKLSNTNKQILVNYMVIEWLDSNYILVPNMLKAHMTTTDFHSLNQYQLLDKITTIRNTLMSENNQLAINQSYKKSSLYDVALGRKVVSTE